MGKSTISINDIKKAIASNHGASAEVEWRDLTIQVKGYLSLKETIEFTRGVINTCFSADTEEYIPEVKDFATRCAILEHYTNIKLPQNLEVKNDLVYGSDIIFVVIQYIDNEQLESICNAIDKEIDAIVQSNVSALNNRMNDIVAGFENIENELSGVFGGVDSDAISKMVGAITNGSFDEDKLVEAFCKSKADKGKVIQMPVESGNNVK